MDDLSDFFADKTVLVTGGAGAIGSNLVRRLNELGTNRITIIDDLSSSYEWNIPKSPRIHFIEGDILNDENLKWAFKNKPQIVYHLAAHFANQNSVDNPETDLMVNGMGTLKVLEHAHLVGVERFVYASSGCGIYGADSKIPFEEEDVSMKLYTPYQVTKMLGELYTNYFHNLYELPIVNARFFNSFGPGEAPGRYRNVIPNFIYWAIRGKPLPITGTGDETRDFTYVGDIVDGLLRMSSIPDAIGEAFNLGAGREIKISDLADWVNEITGNRSGVVHTERRIWDKKNRLLSSIKKAQETLGYRPTTDFREGLRKTHEWFKVNWIDIERDADL